MASKVLKTSLGTRQGTKKANWLWHSLPSCEAFHASPGLITSHVVKLREPHFSTHSSLFWLPPNFSKYTRLSFGFIWVWQYKISSLREKPVAHSLPRPEAYSKASPGDCDSESCAAIIRTWSTSWPIMSIQSTQPNTKDGTADLATWNFATSTSIPVMSCLVWHSGDASNRPSEIHLFSNLNQGFFGKISLKLKPFGARTLWVVQIQTNPLWE